MILVLYKRGKNKTLIVFSTLGQPTSLVTSIDGRDKPFTPHLTYEFVRTVNWELGKTGHFFDMFNPTTDYFKRGHKMSGPKHFEQLYSLKLCCIQT